MSSKLFFVLLLLSVLSAPTNGFRRRGSDYRNRHTQEPEQNDDDNIDDTPTLQNSDVEPQDRPLKRPLPHSSRLSDPPEEEQSTPLSLPAEDESSNKTYSVTEETEELVVTSQLDPFLEDFKTYVLSIPLTAFEDDAILLQFPDPLNKRTTYRHLDPVHAMTDHVYETKQDDSNNDVVILNNLEDNIPAPKGDYLKRVYVVLRKAIQLDPRVYYINYIYITEAADDITGIHNFGSRKVFVEWDFWDRREVYDFRAKSLENAFHCSNYIFIPCASNKTFDLPNPSLRPENLRNVPESSYPGTNPKAENSDVYRVADGYDSNEFLDIYGDLDRMMQLGREVSAVPSDGEPPSSYLDNNLQSQQQKLGVFTVAAGQETGDGGSIKKGNSESGAVRRLVEDVLNGIIGWVKNFGGLSGGLGTSEATLYRVGEENGIEGTDDIFKGETESERNELVSELQQKSAGGLGGMVTGLEDNERPSNLEIDQTKDKVGPAVVKNKGRTLSAVWEPEGDEKPFVQFGWIKTNDVTSANDAFVGFGACRYHKIDRKQLESIFRIDDLIRLYQKALKTQCVHYDMKFFQEIIKDGLLRMAEESKSFELVPEAVHFTTEKLTVKQLKELLRGVQLSMFSQTYNAELKSPSPSTTAPDGTTISRSVYTLGQTVIGTTAFSQEHKWLDTRHGFKLLRNWIRTLKVAYQKLLEDTELLGEGDGGFDKELNFNDRVYVIGLIQYLIRGVSAVYNSEANPTKTFEDFFTNNKHILINRVSVKGRPF